MPSIIPDNLSLPMQTVTGPGAIERLLPMALALGKRGMLVCGRSMERAGVVARIMAACPGKRTVAVWRHTGGEPDLNQLNELLAAARGHDAGMDALTQAIESYVSRGATWWTDTMALKAMERIAVALPAVYDGGDGEEAMIAEILASGSTRANPRPVSEEEARRLLRAVVTKDPQS